MTKSLAAEVRSEWLDLLWRCWRTVGVRASHGPIIETMLDLESIIIATAGLTGDGDDPRVRAHALYWCINNHRLVSTIRLKRLAVQLPAELTLPFRRFAATVNAMTDSRWPDDGVVPDLYAVREFPELPIGSSGGALTKLRLRLLIGANARSEVMATCLANPDSHFGLLELETLTTFSRRHLAEPVADLARGGWLDHSMLGNRNRYRVSAHSRAAFGSTEWLDWPSRFDLLAVLADASSHLDSGSVLGCLAALRKVADQFWSHTAVEAPAPLHPSEELQARAPELREWISNTTRQLISVA